MSSPGYRIAAVGGSAGGVTALQALLANLPDRFPLPIVAVLHLPQQASVDVEMVFGPYFRGSVVEALDKMPLSPNTLYMAPPGYHLQIEAQAYCTLSLDEPLHFSRPSIDMLFQSVAASYGDKSIGVLLSGANQDGAEGLKDIKDHGGYAIIQNPATAEANYMPRSALELFRPDDVLNLLEISHRLAELAGVSS